MCLINHTTRACVEVWRHPFWSWALVELSRRTLAERPHGARRWVNSRFIGFVACGRINEQTCVNTSIERDALPTVRPWGMIKNACLKENRRWVVPRRVRLSRRYNSIFIFCWPCILTSFWLMTNWTHSFLMYLFHASTCFEQQVLIIRRAKLY
jgi:hypothetical protein